MTPAVDHEQPENGLSGSLPWTELPDGLQDVVVEERHDDDADDAQSRALPGLFLKKVKIKFRIRSIFNT